MSERVCLRCGAPYDEGATVCFTCGASIGELETPTQPVRTPKAIAAANAEAIADVANGVSSSVGAVESDAPSEGTRALATEAAPKRMTVGSSYRQTPAPVVTPKPSGRRWAVLGVIALVALALLAGGGYVLRVALAGPPVPKSVIYHDPNGRFSVTVPALWTVTTQASGALLTDSSGANSATISEALAQSGQTSASVADALAKQIGLQTATPVQISGDAWEQRSGQVTGQDGATREIVVLVDVRGSEVYTIQLSSPTASYATINNLVYQPLLASFTFA